LDRFEFLWREIGFERADGHLWQWQQTITVWWLSTVKLASLWLSADSALLIDFTMMTVDLASAVVAAQGNSGISFRKLLMTLNLRRRCGGKKLARHGAARPTTA
jgi:hypothetical protein